MDLGCRQSFASQLQEIALLFVDRPELRRYFYDNCQPMDTVAVQVVAVPEHDRDVWFQFFRDLVSTSPALQARWAETASWYSPALRKVLGAGEPAT